MDLPLVAGVFKDALEDGLGPELCGQAKQNDVFVPGPLVQTVLPNPTLQMTLQYGQHSLHWVLRPASVTGVEVAKPNGDR